MDVVLLHLGRQRGRNAVRIDRVGRPALPVPGRSGASPCRQSAPPCPRSTGSSAARRRRYGRHTSRIGRGFADDLVRALVGVRDPAGDLPRLRAYRTGRKRAPARRRPAVPRARPSRSSARPAAAAFRSSAAQAAGRDPADAPPARCAGCSPMRPPGRLTIADMDDAAQESAGGQHHGRRRNLAAVAQDRRRRRVPPSHEQVDHLALDHLRSRCARISACAAAGRARGRPAPAAPAPPGPCGGSAGETGCPRHRRPRPISRPCASISRTRWPLPSPPMAGLQDMTPMPSSFSVTSAVRAPSRAAAWAASAPAWPPPTTMTSKPCFT